jgi:hypothetical protein
LNSQNVPDPETPLERELCRPNGASPGRRSLLDKTPERIANI